MTNKEALEILDTIPTIGEQVDALEMAIKALEQEPRKITLEDVKGYCKPRCLTIISNELLYELTYPKIKALEQQPILDKIRTEIDDARFVDKDTRFCKNALASGLEVAMQIIDKYKAESEEE